MLHRTQPIAIAATLATFLLISACSAISTKRNDAFGMPTAPQATLDSKINGKLDKTAAKQGSTVQNLNSILTTYDETELGTYCQSSSMNVTSYMSCRKIQIDELCTTFFDGLDKVATGAEFGAREIDIVADTTSTILGLTGTAAKQLAILSGTKLAVDNSIAAAKDALLLSPAPHKIYELVLANQKTTWAGKSSVNNDFESAVTLMRRYAYACTSPGIRELIDTAVTTQTATGSTSTAAAAAALSDVVAAINNQKPATAVTADDVKTSVASLYALFVFGGSNTESPLNKPATAKLTKTMTDDIKAWVTPGAAAPKEVFTALLHAGIADPTIPQAAYAFYDTTPVTDAGGAAAPGTPTPPATAAAPAAGASTQ